MSAIDNLTAAFDDVRAAVALGGEKIRQLAQDLTLARASAADTARIDQIAAELHATADQLRIAVASDPNPPST